MIDENLYSRQLLTFGSDAMKKMVKSNILISGMSGLGVEVAKCVILGGVKSVVLHDEKNIVHPYDLSSCYYLQEQDVGKTKLDKMIDHFKSLNSNVSVSTSTDRLTEEFISNFDVVVFCDYNLYDLMEYNKICRKNDIKFIASNSHGLYGYIFNDLGDEFIVSDSDGEKIKSGILNKVISKMDDNYKMMYKNVIISNEYHKLQVGDFIKIRVDGLLLDDTFKVIKIIDQNSFELDKNPFLGNKYTVTDEKNSHTVVIDNKIVCGKLESTVILSKTEFEQVKQVNKLKYLSLDKSIFEPEFAITNYVDFDRPQLLHAFTMALWMFTIINDEKLPKPWDESDAKKMLQLVRGFSNDINIDIIRKLSYTVSGKLCPNDSIIGSITAQEVMKACSGKYTPIKQWMYIEHLQLFPKVELPYKQSLENFTPNGSRYDGQIVVLGRELTQKLNSSKVFVVGSGAIGCEHIKNFSMMGVGNIVVTDMDRIEKSNLNRQFLFRPNDIGKSKSITAMEKGMIMNPSINIEGHENKVCEDTLNIYDNEFFESLTCVANALDNIPARRFVDGLCVKYKKFLLESGTLGTKCNVQIVVPNESESYSSSEDPEEESIPVCTLKNFPYLFEHVVQYARDLMEGIFNITPKSYLTAKNDFESIREKTKTDIVEIYNNVKVLVENKPNDFNDCIKFSYKLWHENFRDPIYSIIKKFPIDSKTDEGVPFWSGTKKFPEYCEFDVNNENHLNFILHTANIWADVFGIKIRMVDVDCIDYVSTLEPPKIVEQEIKVKEENSDSEQDNNDNNKDDEFINKDELLVKLEALMEEDINTINPIEFEKDDDTNHHIDFITSVANIRAKSYGIELKDRLSVKQIAGKIIPAIATTTSLVSGLVSIELYKVVQNKNKLEDYTDSFCNLATCEYTQCEPKKVNTSIINNKAYNIWESISVDGECTLGVLINMFEDNVLTHKKLGDIDLELLYISHGDNVIYQSFLFTDDKEKEKTLRELILENNNYPESVEELCVSLDFPDDSSDEEDDNIMLDGLVIEPISVLVNL